MDGVFDSLLPVFRIKKSLVAKTSAPHLINISDVGDELHEVIHELEVRYK